MDVHSIWLVRHGVNGRRGEVLRARGMDATLKEPRKPPSATADGRVLALALMHVLPAPAWHSSREGDGSAVVPSGAATADLSD
jgi:hypothetical protein